MAKPKRKVNLIAGLDDEALSLRIDDETAKLAELHAEYQRMLTKMSVLTDDLKVCKTEKMQRIVSRSAETPWELLLNFDPHEAHYQLVQDAMRKLCPSGHVSQSGYFPDLMQYTIQVAFWRGFDKAEILNALKTLLPHIKQFPNGDRVFRLMEPSTSDDGIHQIAENNGSYSLKIIRYHREYTAHTVGSLELMVDYLAKHYAWTD